MTSVSFNYQPKGLFPNRATFWGTGIRISTYKAWRDTVEPITRKTKGFDKEGTSPSRPGFPGVWDNWHLMLTFGWAVWGDYNNGEKCEQEHFMWGENVLCNTLCQLSFLEVTCGVCTAVPALSTLAARGWFPGEFSPNFLCICLICDSFIPALKKKCISLYADINLQWNIII